MAFCTNCGQQATDGTKFCANCGTPITQKVSNTERKTVFAGEIHKCPYCGEILNSFKTVCPTCKMELRGTTTASSVKNFAARLENLSSEEKRIELIKNFYIPNTKEDIYEFFIYAVSNLSVSEKEYEAWWVKLEQAYHKAKLSFGNTPEFEYINGIYIKISKEHNRKMFKKSIKKSWRLILCLILAVISLSITIPSCLAGIKSGDPDSSFYGLTAYGILIPGIAILLIVGSSSSNDISKKK